MRLATIASGSSGNCIYIGTEKRNILIDAGISLKRIETGLESLGLGVNDLDGILITHEHADHIGGLGVLLRKYEVPVYLTEGTYNEIKRKNLLGKVNDEYFQVIFPDTEFSLGDIKAESFSVSHDAAQPVVYRVTSNDHSAAVVTDLGVYDKDLAERLCGLDAVLLEANHDVRMLQTGPYPYPTKQRILGEKGHLSNESAARLLCDINSQRLKHVILGHISKINNYVELALETVRTEGRFSGCEADVVSAPPDRLSDIIEI